MSVSMVCSHLISVHFSFFASFTACLDNAQTNSHNADIRQHTTQTYKQLPQCRHIVTYNTTDTHVAVIMQMCKNTSNKHTYGCHKANILHNRHTCSCHNADVQEHTQQAYIWLVIKQTYYTTDTHVAVIMQAHNVIQNNMHTFNCHNANIQQST